MLARTRSGSTRWSYLTTFDYGTVSTLPNGQTLREYEIVAFDKEIEIAPGVFFPAWTYNGQVPGPTIRCNEGDRLRLHFTNAGSHPHTIHYHGIHSSFMDGVTGIGRGNIEVGETFTYEFDADTVRHATCITVTRSRSSGTSTRGSTAHSSSTPTRRSMATQAAARAIPTTTNRRSGRSS